MEYAASQRSQDPGSDYGDRKERVVRWLDQHAFDPSLRRSPEDYSRRDRERFEHVRRATESEEEPFHNYDSAEEVRRMFLDDLSSRAARPVNGDLEQLEWPKLPDLKGDFLKLCDEVGVQ